MAFNISAGVLEFALKANESDIKKAINKTKEGMEHGIATAVSSGLSAGFGVGTMRKQMKELEASAQKIGTLQASIATLVERANTSGLQSLSAQEQQVLTNTKLAIDGEARILDQRLKGIDEVEKTIKRMHRDEELSMTTMYTKVAEGFGENLHDVFSTIAAKDVGGLIGMLKKGMTGLKALQKQAVASREVGGQGMGALSKFLASVGPALMAIGALAAGFAALAKMVIDADAQAKGLNKTLLEGGVSVGDLAGGAQDLAGSLDEVRKAAISFTNNRQWGTLAQDQLKLLGAFHEAGLTMKEMVHGLDSAEQRMTAYQKATATALTYSKLLGESAEKIAQDLASMMEDTGLSLEGISAKFAKVYDAAQMSGFGTKRFFGMVLQATSGMSMYNVRLEQTASMLLTLNKIIGAKFGPEFFNRLTKGFTDESMSDRIKRIMITGVGPTKEVIGDSAKNAASDFVSTLQDRFKGKDLRTAVTGAFGGGMGDLADELATANDATSKGKASEKLVKALAQMSPEKQALALQKFGEKAPPEVVQQLRKLADLARGTSGQMGDMMKAMDDLDPAATLALQMKQVESFFGRPIHTITDPASLIALEQIMGISGEQLKQMQAVSAATDGTWQRMLEFRKLQEKQGKLTDEQAREMAAAIGLGFTQDGKLVTAKLDEATKTIQYGDKEISNKQQMIMTTSEKMAADGFEIADEQTALAREVAQNTTELTQYIQMGVEYFLEGIYSVVEGILGWLTGSGLSEQGKKGKKEAIEQTKALGQELMQQRKAEQAAMTDAIKKAQMEKDPAKRAELQKEVQDRQATIDKLTAAIEVNKKSVDQIRDMTDSNLKTAGDFMTKAQKDLQDSLKSTYMRTETVYSPSRIGTVSRQVQVEDKKYDPAKIQKFMVQTVGEKAAREFADRFRAKALEPFQKEQEKQVADLRGRVAATPGQWGEQKIAEELARIENATTGSGEARAAENEALNAALVEWAQKGATGKDVIEMGTDLRASQKALADRKKREDAQARKKEIDTTKSQINPDLAKKIAEEEERIVLKRIIQEATGAENVSEADINALLRGQLPASLQTSGAQEKLQGMDLTGVRGLARSALGPGGGGLNAAGRPLNMSGPSLNDPYRTATAASFLESQGYSKNEQGLWRDARGRRVTSEVYEKALSQGIKLPTLDDFLSVPGGGGRQFITDPNDVIAGFKAGGPVDRAAKGGPSGASVVNISGPSTPLILKAMRDARRAGVL